MSERPRRGLLADTTPLKTPAFRRLWTAGVVTVVGAQLTVVAVPFQLYEMTGSSAWVGLTGLFGLVPLVVFGLWGGAIADAVDRRMLLVVSGVGIAVTSALLGVSALTHLGGPWTVLVIFAVQTACLAVNQPTRSAVLPRILPLDQLPAANTLWFTVQQLGAFAGPLVGGVALAFVDVGALYLVDTICLTVSIWAAYRLPRLPVAADAEGGLRGVVHAIRTSAGLRSVVDGFRYAAMSKVLLVSFLADLVAMGFGMPRAVFPQAAVETYGAGPAYGLLSASIAGGAALGGLLSGRLHGIARQGVAVTIAVSLWGVGVALAGLTSILWLAVLLLAAAGAADLVSSVFRSTMLQTVATDEMRGRMQGVFVVVVAGGPRVADLWHGWAADAIGTGAATALGGAAVVVGMLAVVLAFPAFWRYRAPTAGATQDAPASQA
ncbi:MFS transporter [Actinomycetospora chiangmaiensis]|uniref:MFS transporter n=1 Tax=Actinomycetospora chiangmaiensis TaxID=402650 RepID=UPI00035ED456|nr:MFS transporter [Actinomycetospora chiangmaiensis]